MKMATPLFLHGALIQSSFKALLVCALATISAMAMADEDMLFSSTFELPVCEDPATFEPTLQNGTVWPWGYIFKEEFPGPTQDYVKVVIPTGSYLAIEITTDDTLDSGGISTIEIPSVPGSRVGAISRCPGDFDVAPECTYTWGISGGIIWTTEGWPGGCELEPNSTYYINITFTDGKKKSSDKCDAKRCITELRVNNP